MIKDRKIRVAIVEDDASVRGILCDWIGQAEDFICVDNFSDAETALVGLPPSQPHGARGDINLPGISGNESVRSPRPPVPHTHADGNDAHAAAAPARETSCAAWPGGQVRDRDIGREPSGCQGP